MAATTRTGGNVDIDEIVSADTDAETPVRDRSEAAATLNSSLFTLGCRNKGCDLQVAVYDGDDDNRVFFRFRNEFPEIRLNNQTENFHYCHKGRGRKGLEDAPLLKNLEPHLRDALLKDGLQLTVVDGAGVGNRVGLFLDVDFSELDL